MLEHSKFLIIYSFSEMCSSINATIRIQIPSFLFLTGPYLCSLVLCSWACLEKKSKGIGCTVNC